jgi:hypothetical protein
MGLKKYSTSPRQEDCGHGTYVRKYFCVARHGDDVLGAYCASRSVCRVTITVTSVGIENFPR